MTKRQFLGFAAVTVAAAVNLAFLAFRVFFTSRSTFNSDAATTSLYANEILQTHSLFPPGWHYNNADVWLYNHTLIEVPVLAALPDGYAAYAISTTVMALLIVGGIGVGLWALNVRGRVLVAAIAVLAGGISSPFIAELLFDWGGTYGSQILLAFLILVLVVQIVKRPEPWLGMPPRPTRKLAFLAILVAISSTSNPARAMTYHVAPCVLSLGLLWMQARRTTGNESGKIESGRWLNRVISVTVAILVLALAVGGLLNLSVVRTNGGALFQPPIYGADSLMPHLSMVVTSWLYLVGYPLARSADVLDTGVRLVSAQGAYFMARILIALALLASPVVFLRYAIRAGRAGQPLSPLLSMPALGFVLAAVIHLAAFRYPPNDYTSIRYLLTPFALMGIASVAIFKDAIDRMLSSAQFAMFLAAASVVVGYMNNVYPALAAGSTAAHKAGDNSYDSLVACLEKEGMRYGFGGFWSSSVVTVLSDSRVIVRPVSIAERSVDMFPIHSSNRWYSPTAYHGKSFLMLSEVETRVLNQEALTKTLGPSFRNVTCDGFTLHEYGYNIAERLFGNFEQTAILVDISTPHLVGQFDTTTRELNASPGQVGYLMYGPYMKLKKGSYKAILQIRADAGDGGKRIAGNVDVVAHGGTITLARIDVLGDSTWQQVALPFMIDPEVTDLEIRVYTNGSMPVRLRSPVELHKLASTKSNS